MLKKRVTNHIYIYFLKSTTHLSKTNRMGGDVTSRGTQNMLDSWRQKTKVADQRIKLMKALVEAELTAIAEKHLIQGMIDNF